MLSRHNFWVSAASLLLLLLLREWGFSGMAPHNELTAGVLDVRFTTVTPVLDWLWGAVVYLSNCLSDGTLEAHPHTQH